MVVADPDQKCFGPQAELQVDSEARVLGLLIGTAGRGEAAELAGRGEAAELAGRGEAAEPADGGWGHCRVLSRCGLMGVAGRLSERGRPRPPAPGAGAPSAIEPWGLWPR